MGDKQTVDIYHFLLHFTVLIVLIIYDHCCILHLLIYYTCASCIKFILQDKLDDILLAVCFYSELDYDYLADHKYEFSVIATDGGSPPLTGSASVQVIMECFVVYF